MLKLKHSKFVNLLPKLLPGLKVFANKDPIIIIQNSSNTIESVLAK